MAETTTPENRIAPTATEETSRTARRTVLTAGAAGLGLLATGCGSGGRSEGADGAPTATVASGAGTGEGSGAGAGATGQALAKPADIPVGGGKVLADRKLVVTQPRKGEFKAFSSICTHQGCSVREVRSNVIHCPCHGSAFSAEDGSVQAGPATGPLPERKVELKGDSIRLA